MLVVMAGVRSSVQEPCCAYCWQMLIIIRSQTVFYWSGQCLSVQYSVLCIVFYVFLFCTLWVIGPEIKTIILSLWKRFGFLE